MRAPADVTSIPIFNDGEVLRAAQLNRAFESMRLLRAAPTAPGLFRPWWAPDDVKVNAFTWRDPTLYVDSCFAVCPDGKPIAIPNKEFRLRDGQTLCVASDGRVGLSASDGREPETREWLTLATASADDPLQSAPVATCNATQRIEESFKDVQRIAGEWLAAITRNTPRRFFALAVMWRRVQRLDPATETGAALHLLSEVAFFLSLHAPNEVAPSLLDVPGSREHGTVCDWLEKLAAALRRRELKRLVYG